MNIPQTNPIATLKTFLNAEDKTRILMQSIGTKNKDEVTKYLIGVFTAMEMDFIRNQSKNTPQNALVMCSPTSIFNVIKSAIQMGLNIDARQHAHIIKYGNEAQLQIGWRGFVHKVKLSNSTVSFTTKFVWSDDEFSTEVIDGNDKVYLKSKSPFRSDYEKALGIYCYATYVSEFGPKSHIEFVPTEDITRIRNAAKTDMIWKQWYSEMAKKTAIKRACKILFAESVEQLELMDNQQYDTEKLSRDDTSKFDALISKKLEEPISEPLVEHVLEESPQPALTLS